MEVLDQIHNHRSIRKFKPDPIPDKILSQILGAGIRTSSSGNMQTYSIIVTSDRSLREQLLNPHKKQQMVVEAPHLLTFCADVNRMHKWLSMNNAPVSFDNFFGFLVAAVDAILASQTTALAAESFDLGICYLGSTLANCDQIGRILNLPKHVVPVVGFALGYPAESPPRRTRIPLTGLVHHEQYRDYSFPEIDRIYQEKETADWERYLRSNRLRKLVKEYQINNLAALYTRIKYPREEYQEISRRILAYLASQGWMNNDDSPPDPET